MSWVRSPAWANLRVKMKLLGLKKYNIEPTDCSTEKVNKNKNYSVEKNLYVVFSFPTFPSTKL
jgi:hypothetical protein